MKYTDLPKFTRMSHYHVNSSWEYFIEDWVSKRMKEATVSPLNLNPDFQRAHVWTEEQQIAYIEYILKGGMSGKAIYFNHPGWMNTFEGDFVIVDGKQRVEAVRRFIQNEIKVFGYYYKEFEGRLPAHCEFDVYINNLQTRKEVLQWYLEFNSGGVVHTKEELDKVRSLLEEEI